MDWISTVSFLLGSGWSSGINLYLTVAGLGIAHRMQWLTLPGQLESISHPAVIGFAVALYAVEFLADKIPYVDSVWDSVHTFIRPAGGMVLGYLAMSDLSPSVQVPVAILTGAVSLDSHLTKATSRIAINTSPEPLTNTVASVTEDAAVAGVLYLIVKHPIIAGLSVIAFILFSIWFLKKMFIFLKRILKPRKAANTAQEN